MRGVVDVVTSHGAPGGGPFPFEHGAGVGRGDARRDGLLCDVGDEAQRQHRDEREEHGVASDGRRAA